MRDGSTGKGTFVTITCERALARAACKPLVHCYPVSSVAATRLGQMTDAMDVDRLFGA